MSGMHDVVATVVNLNSPGRYYHWSIFDISEANLVLVGVMVVIFGLALLLPFPTGRHDVVDGDGDGDGDGTAADATMTGQASGAPGDGIAASTQGASTASIADSRMWTARLRNRALALLPPGKLLPDRQPAYVASWVYVFGVASLAALGMAIASGAVIAIGGTDWWHTNAIGHFFNSLHLWSVELFMALLVIHLWGKFWMAAWRGRRALTWMTGVIAFAAAVGECFTGYLSQQNFDSQWIATNGKDAFNAIGIGAFFNVMNFGQMLLWHVVLFPLILVAIVGAHVLLVRVRGVSHPLPARRARGRAERRAAAVADRADWRGPKRRYDIIKEATIATSIVLALVVVMAAVLSSPDAPPVTIQSWAQVAPADFLGTAASELQGTSKTATYGPPFNNGTSSVQRIGFSLQTAIGVHYPIDPAKTFVIDPLDKVAPADPPLEQALRTYRAASESQRQAWLASYQKVLTGVRFASGAPVLRKSGDGPVPVLLATELNLARTGALDAALIANHAFYGTDFTKPLMFMEDGEHFAELAQKDHLTGDQWGVMNETGSYPGQPWLWMYQLWYQVPGFHTSANVDLIAIYLTGLGTLLLLFIPFIPGLRDIPRMIPVHKVVWRSWHRSGRDES